MACYHPLKGWMKRQANPKTGKRGITFTLEEAWVDMETSVPCGQCIGCRLERSRQWAVRIMHESQLHDSSWFLTLTYSPEHLPPGGTLVKSDFQKFMKRLRKAVEPTKVRFFHCGEYGEDLQRPHYHAAIFGPDLSDRFVHDMRGEHPVWRSPTIERAWPVGFSELGSLTFESAAYMARYVTKKVNGGAAAGHYGELQPEYATMSRRPGIGRGWLERYGKEVYPADEIIMRGMAQRPPQYYDRELEDRDPELAREVAERRRRNRNYAEETERRLAVREEVTRSRVSTYERRGYEV